MLKFHFSGGEFATENAVKEWGGIRMITSELIDRLSIQAKEIENDGHAGWGNTMLDAAQKLKECQDAMQTFIARVENGEIRSKKTYAQFKGILD